MGFGDFIGRSINSVYGTDAQGNPTRQGMFAQSLGQGYDFYQARRQAKQDEAELRRQQTLQRNIMNQQMAMAQQRAGEETALRQGVVDRTRLLEQALMQARQAMGQSPVATQDDINREYQSISEMMKDEYGNVIDRVSSQGFADAIAKGMDRSDRFRDTQRELGETSAEELRKIDQEAYNAAISRLGSNLDVLYQGRDKRLGEIEDVMGAGISNLQSAMPTNAGTLYGNAQTQQNTVTTGAQTNFTDSSDTLGTIAGNIGKNVAPNIGYMLGKTPNYTNSNQAEIERLENEIRDLQRSNNRLRGVGNNNPVQT